MTVSVSENMKDHVSYCTRCDERIAIIEHLLNQMNICLRDES